MTLDVMQGRARALGLLHVAMAVHDRCRAECDAAIADHSRTLDELVAARDRFVAAGAILLEAVRSFARWEEL
jgi:hypothetical protein